MTNEEYAGWVQNHCRATAAGADAATALLSEPVRRYFAEQFATAGELGECTYRLVAKTHTPKFANEHSDTVAVELRSLREERAAAQRPDPGRTSPDGPLCGWCGDSGLVTVPHPVCVEVPHNAPPRLVPYRDRNGIRYASVVEVSVLCDRRDCPAGRRTRDAEAKSKTPRPTFTTYSRPFGSVNVVALLAEHNREVAAHCQRTAGPGGSGFAKLVEQIKARAAQSQGEAA